MRWPGRRTVLLASVTTVIVVVGAVVAIVSSGWLHEWVRRLALSQLRQSIDGVVTLERVGGSLVSGLSAEGLRIVQDGHTVVEVDELVASYDLVRLLRGSWIVDEVRLVRPRIVARRNRDGWNLARLARARATPRDPGPWNVDLSRVVVVDGRVRVEVPGRPVIVLDTLEAAARLRLSEARTDVSVAHATFREATAGVAVSSLAGNFAIAGTELSLGAWQLKMPGLAAGGDLRMDDGQVARANVTVTLAEWSANRLMPHLPEMVRQMPPTTGTLTVTGGAPDFVVAWSLGAREVGHMDGRIGVGWSDDYPLVAKGRVNVAEFNPASLLRQADLAGRVRASVTLDASVDPGRPERTSVTVGIEATESSLAGYRIERLNARADLRGARVFGAGAVRAYDAGVSFQVTTQGGMDGRPLEVAAKGTVVGLDARKLPPALRVPAIDSHVTADYAARYTRAGWSVSATSRATTLAGFEIDPGSVVRVEHKEREQVLSAHVDAALSRVPASRLRLPSDEVSDLQVRLRADVVTDSRRPSSIDALSGSAVVSAVEYDSSRVNPTRADLDIGVIHGVAEVRRFEVHSPLVLATARGHVSVTADSAGDSALDYRVDIPDLARLASLGIPGLTGGARAEGRVTGPSTEWRVASTVAAHEIGYVERGRALALNATVSARVPVGRWTDTEAEVDLDGSFINIGSQEIPRLSLATSYANGRLNVEGRVEQAARSMDLASAIDLHPDHQEIHLRQLTIAGGGPPWRLAGGDEVLIRYSPTALAVEKLTLRRETEELSIDGRLALDAAGPSDGTLTVAITNVDLGDVTSLAVGTARVDGTMTGTVEVGGTLAARTAIADVALRDGAVADVPFSSITVDAELRDRLANLHATVVETGGTTLEIAGRVPTAVEAGPLDLRVQSTPISLGLVQAATSAVSNVAGTAVLDLHVTGRLDAPDVDGRVVVGGGALAVTATGVAYRDINADIRLTDGWAIVEQATLTDDDGHIVEVAGRMATRVSEGRLAVEMTLRGQDIRVLNNDLGDVSLDMDLQIAGAIGAPRVTGDLVGARVRLEVDALMRAIGSGEVLPPETATPEAGTAAAAMPAPPSRADTGAAPAAETASAAVEPAPASGEGPWGASTIDMTIRLPENAVLRGRDLRIGAGSMGLGDLNMTVGGTLRLRKSPGDQAGIVGAVEVVRGFYEFQGRRFTVGRGSAVRFRGNELTNPVLDVTGEREVSGVTALVRVAGTAQRPVLSLSSRPALAESDVLALIVFNQPLNQLGTSQQADLLERAGDIALGALASSLTESIGRALDVDLFEIRAPTAGEAGEVALGTQVNERVFIGVRQEFGASEISRVSIEYRISEALRLLTSVAQGSGAARGRTAEVAGIDFVYTVKY